MFTFAGRDSEAGLGFLCVKEKVDGHGGNACLVRKGTSELRSPFRPFGGFPRHHTALSGILMDSYMCD